MESKTDEIKGKLMEEGYREFTNDEIISMCVSVVYNGIFKNGWNVRPKDNRDNLK